jgi:hypothetical protein
LARSRSFRESTSPALNRESRQRRSVARDRSGRQERAGHSPLPGGAEVPPCSRPSLTLLLGMIYRSRGRHRLACPPSCVFSGVPGMHLIDRRAHTNAEPHFILYVWLRIRVAFGVFSGLPVPTDDPLASLHVVAHTWTAQPNPAWLPGGGLIGSPVLTPHLHEFHPFRPCRTLRFERKRRLPPARERLAKHSGDGSGESVGMVQRGGDESGGKLLNYLKRRPFLSPHPWRRVSRIDLAFRALL